MAKDKNLNPISVSIEPTSVYNLEYVTTVIPVTVTTLATLLNEGKMKGKKIGYSWYVTGQAILDYLNEKGGEDD